MVAPVRRTVPNYAEVDLNIAGNVNRDLLRRLMSTLLPDADRLALKYGRLILKTAREEAPSSEETNNRGWGSSVPRSNNPHATTIRKALKLQTSGPARYVISMGAAEQWGKYIITGTRAHPIWAGNRSGSRTKSPKLVAKARRRVSRIEKAQDKLIGQLRAAEDHASGRGRAIKDALGTIQGYAPRRVSLRSETARGRRQERLQALDEQLSLAEEAVHDARVGKPQLVFPWEGAEVNSRGQQIFVGSVVHHRLVEPNNFLGRARQLWGPRFAADLKRLLEGKGVS